MTDPHTPAAPDAVPGDASGAVVEEGEKGPVPETVGA